MTTLTGAGGLALLLFALTLTIALDAPGGPTGWRSRSWARPFGVLVLCTVIAAAGVATWQRLLG
jgi:hypothetical protein